MKTDEQGNKYWTVKVEAFRYFSCPCCQTQYQLRLIWQRVNWSCMCGQVFQISTIDGTAWIFTQKVDHAS